jgi:C4-dicarboxylate-specific signal transduction histidine kinase
LPEVPIDRIQIQQVLINLIRNAVDAMEGRDRRDLTIRISRDHGATSLAWLASGLAFNQSTSAPEHESSQSERLG